MTVQYRSVLLVEDDVTLCGVIERNLSARRARVVRAASVGEALAAIAAARPDVMLLDIDLPHRTGWDLLRTLASRGIQVATIVASGSRVTPERLAQFKPLACLPKPYPLEALLQLVFGEHRMATDRTG